MDLIFSTLEDINYFMTVLVSLCLMFMSGFYMIHLNRIETGENLAAPIFDEGEAKDGTLYGSGIIHQYFLLLGEFNTGGLWRSNEGYDDSAWITVENWLSILYFVGSTFITQIVIFNMLVAIMSATFDRHNEDLDQNAKRQKLTLQAQYAKLVTFY